MSDYIYARGNVMQIYACLPCSKRYLGFSPYVHHLIMVLVNSLISLISLDLARPSTILSSMVIVKSPAPLLTCICRGLWSNA